MATRITTTSESYGEGRHCNDCDRDSAPISFFATTADDSITVDAATDHPCFRSIEGRASRPGCSNKAFSLLKGWACPSVRAFRKPSHDGREKVMTRNGQNRAGAIRQKHLFLRVSSRGQRAAEKGMNMKQEEELTPEGLPLNRQMKQNDQVTETSPGLEVTSPNALSGRPSGFMVGQTAPGASEAPRIAVESPRAVQGNAVPEYKWPALNLPEQLSARQIHEDRSNPDGCSDGRQR
jgi:hypothetical protein